MEARARIGRLIGRLGEVSDRQAALAALDRELPDAGLSWGAVASFVASGELPGGERDVLLHRLVRERLNASLSKAWAMAPGEAAVVRKALAGGVGLTEINAALRIADHATRVAK